MSGADKNKKNDLGRVCGDVLNMPGAMPGKRISVSIFPSRIFSIRYTAYDSLNSI